jgi:molybdopterin-biosynthesis enzyme MoeA-like protein
MAEFPEGASLIPNPYNRIAGFTVGHHHFVPGFPVMAWPMIEWVLDTHYRHLFHATAQRERALLVFEETEAALTPLMEALQRDYPGVKVFSLPSVGDAQTRRHIELGVKGDADAVTAAFDAMEAELVRRGAEFQVL